MTCRIYKPEAKNKAGYRKITGCCSVAADYGCDDVWIDTCCIDKSSSAELLEAINSMYRWYKGAKVCYTYLADMTLTDVSMAKSALRNCRWFSRGWTLQELIAPSWLILFDANWIMIGTK